MKKSPTPEKLAGEQNAGLMPFTVSREGSGWYRVYQGEREIYSTMYAEEATAKAARLNLDAAAPDLLAALKRCEAEMTALEAEEFGTVSESTKAARRAIAKAEGAK